MKEMFALYDSGSILPSLQEMVKGLQKSQEMDEGLSDLVGKLETLFQDFSNLKYAIDKSIIIAATDVRGTILYANEKFCELSQYRHDELIGQNHRLLNSGYHDKSFFKEMWKAIGRGEIWEGDIKNGKKDGSHYWVRTTIVPIKNQAGKPFMYISLRTDITEGKKLEEKSMSALRSDFHFVLNSMNHLIFKVTRDKAGQFVYSFIEGGLVPQLGLESSRLQQKRPEDILPAHLAEWLKKHYAQAYTGQELTYNYSFRGRNLLSAVSPVYEGNEVVELIGSIKDITDLQEARNEIEFIAFHDHLTSLPNRRKFTEDVSRLIALAKEQDTKFALCFLDLDRFKQVNDSLGHTRGDQLLKEVTSRLKSAIEANGCLYRFAGDEFIAVYPNIETDEQAAAYATTILSAFERMFRIDETLELYTTASIGISIFPEHGEDMDTLLKNADSAMYAAKKEGRNTYKKYAPRMNQYYQEYLVIENYLRDVIKNDELELYFQPKFDLATKQITGMEALLRWHHPVLGNVPPNKFIPIAEDTGFIITLDEWVLKKACLQAKEWNESGLCRPLHIAVNISPLQFRHPHFPEMVREVLRETGLAPKLLELEITENTVIENTEDCIECLKSLREIGVKVAIDDFGTGYSSFNYLKKLPITSLKIDQTFVKEISQNNEDIAIVKAITYLAHEMQLSVVAEGVETKAALDFLSELGCDEIQGFYISKPLPKAEFEGLIKAGTAR